MISVKDAFSCKNFNDWVYENQEMLALIARQGGGEGILRSIIGSNLQLNSDFIFIQEKSLDNKSRVDLLMCSTDCNLVCEFKHNFIHQSIGEIRKNFNNAVIQVERYSNLIPHRKIYKEVVLFLIQIFEVNQKIPDWATKYKNNDISNPVKSEKMIEDVRLFSEKGFVCGHDGYRNFTFCADGAVNIKLHTFVYAQKN